MFRVYVTEMRSGFVNVFANSAEEAINKVREDWEHLRRCLVQNKESLKIHKAHEPQSIYEMDPLESLLEDPVDKEVIEAYDDESATQQPL